MHTAGVVIVGGGIAGLSLAWRLAERGRTDVLVLEAEPMLATGTTAHAVGGIRRQTGDAVLTALATDSLAFYQSFEERFGTPCDLRQDGYLFLATSDEEWAALREQGRADRQAGVPVDTLSPEGCAEIVPSLRTDDLRGGVYCAQDGFLDPYSAAMGFATAARRLGVRIETSRRLPDPAEVDADVVVLAIGPALREWTGLEITVAKRHVFALTPSDALPHPSPLVLQTDPPFYALADSASVLISPAEAEEGSLTTTVDEAALDVAIARATHRIPALAECGVRRGWAGLRSLTFDGRPAVGFLEGRGRLFVTGAFNGKGVMLAPALSDHAAALIVGAEVDEGLAAALSPSRLDPARPDHHEQQGAADDP